MNDPDLLTTPSQTVGPFFHIGLDSIAINDLVPGGATDKAIVIAGRVLDGDGQPVIDALVEIWQANERGKYRHPEDTQEKPLQVNFRGYGRIATDANGAFRFRTIKPGRVPGPNGTQQAPHLAINVFMRGLLKHLVTRIYFSDETSNRDDNLLNQVMANRRHTLIAKKTSARDNELEWNIILQGENETVFFDC